MQGLARLAMIVGMAWGAAALGQKTAPATEALPAKTGSVVGHVLLAESQRPGRQADITLVLKPNAVERARLKANKTADPADEKEEPERYAASGDQTAVADLNGSFIFNGVPAGEYWAVGSMAGYVTPVGESHGENDLADIDKVMAEAPSVTVEPGKTSRVDVTLHLGARITGRVLFEDGMPVTRAVFLDEEEVGEPARPKGSFVHYKPLGGLGRSLLTQTDFEGRYHLLGLRPGKYRIDARVWFDEILGGVEGGPSTSWSRSAGSSIDFYAPGVFHSGEGRVIEIRASETITDVDLILPLNGLRVVSGRVVAKTDQHGLNGGDLTITDDSDSSFERGTELLADGTFRVSYLPPGTYTLTIDNLTDFVKEGNSRYGRPKILKSYQTIRMPLVVTEQDVALGDLPVEEKPAPPAQK